MILRILGFSILGIYPDNWNHGIDRCVYSTCQKAHRHLLEKDRKPNYNSMVKRNIAMHCNGDDNLYT